MNVLIADKLDGSAVESLRAKGFDVVEEPVLSGDLLTRKIAEVRPHVLIVRSTRVPAEAMETGTLELIVRAGAGYDNIDVEAASAHGIFVSNCPGKNAAAVAELAIGLMIALDRRIPDNVEDARKGRWNKADYSKADGLKGRTLGIVGLGSIGREVVARALALEMNVVAWSRSLTPEEAQMLGVEMAAGPLDVASRSDVVSLHVASNPQTQGLAGREFFEAMQDGACFINTTRSSVVDEEALLWALDARRIRAALDVFSDEPSTKEGAFTHPLASHPSVYLTHHIGASTRQAQVAIALEASRVVAEYATNGVICNCVNIALQSPATHLITVRHLDRVGVLAAVLDECRTANWNVQEMENRIFEGGQAAVAKIRFHGDADPAVVEKVRANKDVLAVSLVEL